jgi:hypothetical protein
MFSKRENYFIIAINCNYFNWQFNFLGVCRRCHRPPPLLLSEEPERERVRRLSLLLVAVRGARERERGRCHSQREREAAAATSHHHYCCRRSQRERVRPL